MTTPAPLANSPYLERWGHPGATIVLGAAQGAPAAGTTQAWPVTVAGPAWPGASPDVAPTEPGRYPEILRVRDLDDQREIIRVLHTSRVAGQWDVMRGDQGTTPVPHANGAELVAAVSAEGLAARAQGVPSGLGLVIPTGVATIQSWTNSNENRLTSVTVPANETADGRALYQATAFGYVSVPFAQSKTITFAAHWGAAVIGTNGWVVARLNDTNQNDACRWRVDCWAAVHTGGTPPAFVTSTVQLTIQNTDNADVQSVAYMAGPTNQHTHGANPPTPTTINTAQANDYYITAQLAAAGPLSTFVLLGGRAWRAG